MLPQSIDSKMENDHFITNRKLDDKPKRQRLLNYNDEIKAAVEIRADIQLKCNSPMLEFPVNRNPSDGLCKCAFLQIEGCIEVTPAKQNRQVQRPVKVVQRWAQVIESL